MTMLGLRTAEYIPTTLYCSTFIVSMQLAVGKHCDPTLLKYASCFARAGLQRNYDECPLNSLLYYAKLQILRCRASNQSPPHRHVLLDRSDWMPATLSGCSQRCPFFLPLMLRILANPASILRP